MNVTLYGSDAEKVHGLLQQVQEEREVIRVLQEESPADISHTVGVVLDTSSMMLSLTTKELIEVYRARVQDINNQLEQHGIVTADEDKRPVLVMPKRPVDEPANSWATGETT
jgi:hypothetical protein